ncbi:allantoicase [Streptomyces actinomycinicus]|uniref:Probable allantoicase n=1 Tax=Streptomyces actinomycinicus TaxID=1695166 RepID=A0A937EQV6_9ACTN|nr:allantoicase [Streptomyces actinomycinicus]MBL1086536.1 allantoicase [Streptomyces actinomycinicus]
MPASSSAHHPAAESAYAAPYVSGDPYADYRHGDFAFTRLTDLADRRLGAAVVAADDEFFAERENLLSRTPAVFDVHAYGNKGKIMDGWETRRRRGTDAHDPFPADGDRDWALIRLGAPGIVRGIVVDTAHFRGNFPQQVSVQAAAFDGTPSVAELLRDPADWHEILPRTPVRGHAANGFAVDSGRRWTHLRVNQYPDGGIARLRVHGEVLPDPAWLAVLGTVDVACVINGGSVEDASDGFYSSPGNTIMPGLSQKQDDGWETRRRRDGGNDWISYRLAAQSEIRAVEIDTANLKGNAAGWASLSVKDGPSGTWTEVLRRVPLQPDALHRFPLPAPATATHARLDVFPDGGLARLRLHGALTPAGAAELADRADRADRAGRD